MKTGVRIFGLVRIILVIILFLGCSKGGQNSSSTNTTPQNFTLSSWSLNDKNSQSLIYDIPKNIILKLNFSTSVNRNSVPGIITLKDNAGNDVSINVAYANSDSNVFISRADGLARMQKIVSFLKNTAQTFHGAFPHWLNGTTGSVIPFSAKDDGADLVETSYLMQGLLTARQFFNGTDTSETGLRNNI